MNRNLKSKLSQLELVTPPISNNEAILLKEAPTIVEHMKKSDIYMIGGKPEGLFTNINFDEKEGILKFDLMIDGNVHDSGGLDIRKIPWIRNQDNPCRLQAGKRAIEFVPGHEINKDERILDRYTPERVLWLRSRFSPEITGLDKYKELSVYDLLYVGIAKVGDSYSRLIKNGHKARMEILANEPQRCSGSRVSDETFLFFFQVNSLLFSINSDLDFSLINQKKVVADAEKAYVSLLKPKYNIVKFKGYPEGKDGLYKAGLNNYGYSIAESLTFKTAHGEVKGSYHPYSEGINNDSDFIFIEENKVTLHISDV